MPKTRIPRLTPAQKRVLVDSYDVTLGGVVIICGRPKTISALVRAGLAEVHWVAGMSFKYDTAKRTPFGDEVREALLERGHPDGTTEETRRDIERYGKRGIS